MAYLKQHSGVDNFLVSLVMDHERYRPLVEIIDNIVVGADELTWKELELIGLEVSDQMASHFCSGVRKGMISALDDDNEAGRDIRVLVEFAALLTNDVSSVTQETIENIRKSGWSDKTIEDVVAWVSVMKSYATLDQGLGFGSLSEEDFEQMGQLTVERKSYVFVFNHFVEG